MIPGSDDVRLTTGVKPMNLRDMFDQTQVITAMRATGTSTSALARAVGVSRQAIGAILRGSTTPRVETAKRIADALGLDPVSLWGGFDGAPR